MSVLWEKDTTTKGGKGPKGPGMQLWKLEKARVQMPPPPQPLEEAQSCPCFGSRPFWTLASRTVRGLICVILSGQGCGDVSRQPQKTNMVCLGQAKRSASPCGFMEAGRISSLRALLTMVKGLGLILE